MTDAEKDRELLALRKATQAVWLIHREIEFNYVALEGESPYKCRDGDRYDCLVVDQDTPAKDLCVSYLAGVIAGGDSELNGAICENLNRVVGFRSSVEEVEGYHRLGGLIVKLDHIGKVIGLVMQDLLSLPVEGRMSHAEIKKIYNDYREKMGMDCPVS